MNVGWQYHEMKITKKKSNDRTPVNKPTKYGTRSILSCFMPRTVDDGGPYEAASPATANPQTEDNPHDDMTVRSLSCSSNQPLAVETATAVNVLSESPAACQCPSQTVVKDTNILKELSSDVHGEMCKTPPCYVTFDIDSRRNSRQSDQDVPELTPTLRPDRQSVTSASAPDVERVYSEIEDDSPPPLPLRADADTKRKSLHSKAAAARPTPRRKAPAIPASDHETDEIRPTGSDQTDLMVPRKTRSNQPEPNECDRDSYVYAVRSNDIDMSIRFPGEENYGDYDTICEAELSACDSEVFDVKMQTLQVNDRAACCSESTFESTDSGMFEPRVSLTDCGSKDNVSERSARSDTYSSDDDDNGATIEYFKDASAVSNFRTRALTHKNLRGKISSFMFDTDEVTVILRHDCKLDNDTFDVEQLARELGTRSSLLKFLKLTKPPVIELMAGPGESVRCFPEGQYHCAIKCTGGCYIFANGKTYLLMTAHKTHRNDVVESVGQHGQLGRIVKRIEQVRSRVTYDMALVELTISGAEDVRNVIFDAVGNTAAVLDMESDGVVVNTGDKVRKFASGSNTERQMTGTVTHLAYYHEDGPTFRDCFCVAPDADSQGFSQPGVSGTLLTTLPSNANDRRVSPIGMITGRVWMETEQFGLHVSGACPSAMHFAIVQKWPNIVRRLRSEPGFENMQLVHASDRRVAMQCTEHLFRTPALVAPDSLFTSDTSLTHLATNVMPRSPLLTVAQQVSDDVADFLAEDTFGWPVASQVFPPPFASAAASASPLPSLSSLPPPKPPKRPPPRGTTPMVPVSPKLYIPVRSSTDVKAPVVPPRIPPRQHSGVTDRHESAVTLGTLYHSPRRVPFEAAERSISLGFSVQLQVPEQRLSELATVPHPDTVIPLPNALAVDALEDKPNYVHMYANKDDVPPPVDKAAQRPQHHEYCEVPDDLPTDCQSTAQSAASQPTPTPDLPPLPIKRTRARTWRPN